MMMAAIIAVLSFTGAIPARAQGQSYYAHPDLISIKTITIYYDTVGPMSFLPMTRRDLPIEAVDIGEVSGDSCQNELSVPTSASIQATTITAAKGNGSYERAVLNIYKANPGLAGIYDVKADIHIFSILFGIFQRKCTEILARGYKLPNQSKT